MFSFFKFYQSANTTFKNVFKRDSVMYMTFKFSLSNKPVAQQDWQLAICLEQSPELRQVYPYYGVYPMIGLQCLLL